MDYCLSLKKKLFFEVPTMQKQKRNRHHQDWARFNQEFSSMATRPSLPRLW